MLQDFAASTAASQGQNDHEDLKKKREEFSMEIRRDSRQQLFQKKRNMINSSAELPVSEKGFQSTTQPTVSTPEQNVVLKEFIEVCVSKTYTMEDFSGLIESINSQEIKLQHYGVIGLRKILSIEEGPPIQAVIDANLVPKFIEFMQRKDQPHLQLEAAWALTNVASGTTQQTQTIIDKGGIPLFVELLKSKHPQVAEQAIWALGNIAGDSSVYRDMLIRCGGMDPLIKLIEEALNKNTVKHGTWALSNLCRGRPLPKFELVFKSIPTFCKVIKEEQDPEVLTDATWALSYLSDGSETRIEMVVKTGIIPVLISFLEHPFLSILIPSLRTLGNIVTGSDTQTNEVISHGALERFFTLLGHDKKAVRREACWSLSNITAGTPDQIAMIVSQPKYIEKLICLINTDCTEIKREAAWVLSNATNRGYSKDVTRLVEYGVLKTFIELLDSDDVKTVAVVLEAIKNILKHGKELFPEPEENKFLTLLDGYNAVPKLEKLQLHPNDEIYEKALKILETYFTLEDPI